MTKNDCNVTPEAKLTDARAWIRTWLTDAAFPVWWRNGYDHAHGGFFDKLDEHGVATVSPKRLRVQARQIYVYCQAGGIGWPGPWRQAVEGGLAFMLHRYRRSDGLFRRSVGPDGSALDDRADLYDQAFVLFALASAAVALRRPELLTTEACALLETLRRTAGHASGGFHELDAEDDLLRSNPHMHMLEAVLACNMACAAPVFAATARELVDLAARRFIDPTTGAVGEYFDQDWSFAPGSHGSLREPGHQFEWAYLLSVADSMLGTNHRVAIDRLYLFGSRYGVRDGRVIFSVDADGDPTDSSSRLWAQTERLRTAMILCPSDNGDRREAHLAAGVESFSWIKRHLDGPALGLWRDRVTASGALLDEPAPASSFYHLLTGFLTLLQPRALSDEHGSCPF